MKYKVLPNRFKNQTEINILVNRGIPYINVQHYLHLTDDDINEPELLGEDNLYAAAQAILCASTLNKKVFVIVDSDCDGFTSSAILLNYLYKFYPNWVQNNFDVHFHEGKQHGLSDVIEDAVKYDLVICADSSSNDYECHKRLKEKGIDIIILDHHLADKISEDAIIINNQLSSYPNKELCGAGVVWQFCRYLDKFFKSNFADSLVDLAALGLIGDMMSLRSTETRRIVTKGFHKDNIKNPFIKHILIKNEFPLSKPDYKSFYDGQACTPMGAAFFIVPFVNAVNRSGKQDEKQLLFNSMLEYRAYEKVPSTKRGHALGEIETIVLQAMRMITNVKNRQTKAEENGMTMLKQRILKNDMLKHKMLLFQLDDNEIEPEIRGLIANKLMALYQRPCAILTKREDENLYEGSMRGYTKTGVNSFKDVCDNSSGVVYCEGHDNAAGLGIQMDKIDEFLDDVDDKMVNITDEPVYEIDYLFEDGKVDANTVLAIADMNDVWGQDIERAYIGVKFKVNKDNFVVMKSNTLKFKLPCGIDAIKFSGEDDEINRFKTSGFVEILAICKCNKNEWQGKVSPQLLIEAYDVIDSSEYYF